MLKKNKSEIIKQAVLKTLLYADIFDYPLTAKQLHARMQGNKEIRKNTEGTLDRLIEEGRIEKREEYYFFPGREEIVALRKKREKYAQKKLEIAQQTVKLISWVPTVKFVGVTGSVAAGNAEKDDDIDFFIISFSGWLWSTRLIVSLILTIFGKRRYPDDEKVKDKICLNLFVDEAYVDVFDKNLFTAYELVQLKPLVDKNNTYHKLIYANKWVKKYFPNTKKINVSTSKNFNYNSGSRTIVEKLFYKVQLWWMRKRRTTEITKPYLIAFHPEDISQEVMVKYKDRVKSNE